jgi:hypothetical protein
MKQIFTGLVILLLLFGCAKTQDKTQSESPKQNIEIKLIRLNDTQLNTLSKKQLQVLARAEEDIQQILHGEKPLNAKLHAAASDGGTRWYKCEDYDVYSWKSLRTFMGIDGYIRGVSITFASSYFKGDDKDFSYTWFEPR